MVSETFGQVREDETVIIKNHGVIAVGSNIHQKHVQLLSKHLKNIKFKIKQYQNFSRPKYVLDNK